MPSPDPFSLQNLCTWLETKPGEEEYDFLDATGQCLFGQFYAAMGLPWKEGGSKRYCEHDSKLETKIAAPYPRTFGAALARAKAYRDRSNVG